MSTSKQLGSLLRKAPPATASVVEPAMEADQRPTLVEAVAPAAPAAQPEPPAPATPVLEPEVPLQVKLPASIRKKIDFLSVERGESLRTLVLRGFQSLGIEVPEEELKGRRGKRS
jgi:hypothetical protein